MYHDGNLAEALDSTDVFPWQYKKGDQKNKYTIESGKSMIQ